MCGITGFWDNSGKLNSSEIPNVVEQMVNKLIHRGPDSGGVWLDGEVGVALGHRRLAIVDLSPEGHQPMMSDDGRYLMVFNGEIYNFLELRKYLETLGYRFRGHSDTEVMLSAFCQWGVWDAVQRFNGMFAFAVWDRKKRILYLGRDRMGEKPLYYSWIGQTLVFASELKSLKAYPNFPAEIDRDALALFLRYSYIPAPYSIYKGVYKLPPATILSWNGIDCHSQPLAYWSMRKIAESGITSPFKGSESEAIEQIDALLKEVVGQRMIADVPLGAFLSGGIDSSTIVALMQSQTCQPVKTFTIGFYEKGYNEAEHAKAVAQHLGTNHTEFYVSPAEAFAVIPKLPILYDEPFSDVSQIPTFLVSQLARQHVTVSLSGDGGDELFGGYSRYLFGDSIWKKIAWIPKPLRKILANSITSLSPQSWDCFFNQAANLWGGRQRNSNFGYYVSKVAQVMNAPEAEAIYADLISHWKNPETVVIGSSEPTTVLYDPNSWAQLPEFIQRMMYLDSVSYLPDDILVKLDRASMGVGLEGRIPLLDHRVVEFAWRIPLSMKIRHRQSKWLLRQVLYKYVPETLIERPKMGFNVPINSWLREPLRDWAENLLDKNRLEQQGFFNPLPIRQKWCEHIRGDRNWEYYLWDILMFQSWLEIN